MSECKKCGGKGAIGSTTPPGPVRPCGEVWAKGLKPEVTP